MHRARGGAAGVQLPHARRRLRGPGRQHRRGTRYVRGTRLPSSPLHPPPSSQRSFVDLDALQCGYCTPGQHGGRRPAGARERSERRAGTPRDERQSLSLAAPIPRSCAPSRRRPPRSEPMSPRKARWGSASPAPKYRWRWKGARRSRSWSCPISSLRRGATTRAWVSWAARSHAPTRWKRCSAVPRYTADVLRPAMLHAAFVRAPVASGSVIEIDLGRALALPGVRGAPPGGRVPGVMHGGAPLFDTTIHWAGQPLAALCADTRSWPGARPRSCGFR